MDDQIVDILKRCRRRLLAVRSAEAAAVAATAGGLIATATLSARVLVARYPLAAAGLAAAVLLAGVVLTGWRRLRARVCEDRAAAWIVAVAPLAIGAAALALVLLGKFEALPQAALAAIVPALAAGAGAVVLVRGAPLDRVARLLDQRAALRERLATALEVRQSADPSDFAEAVVRQATRAAADGALPKVSFWNRSRALAGAMGLSVLAAAMLLLLPPMESPHRQLARAWERVAGQSGTSLADALAAMGEEDFASADVATQIDRLRALAAVLKSGRAEAAGQWQGKVIELDRIAEALRQRIRSGDVPAEQAQRLAWLLRVVEQAAADVVDEMTGAGGATAIAQPAGVDPSTVTPARPSDEPVGWTTVYNQEYAGRVDAATGPATSEGPTPTAGIEVPFDRQWAAARAQAEASAQRGDVPMKYRRVIRDYFADRP